MRRGEKIRLLTDDRILRSVLDIAVTSGEHAITMESVSKYSGVAKTTLYRRYKNRKDMLAQLRRTIESTDFSPKGFAATPEGLEKYALWLTSTYSSYVAVTKMASVLFAHTPFLLAVSTKILADLHTGIIQLIAEGQKAGAFPASVKPRVAADLLIGGVLLEASSTGTINQDMIHNAIIEVFPETFITPLASPGRQPPEVTGKTSHTQKATLFFQNHRPAILGTPQTKVQSKGRRAA